MGLLQKLGGRGASYEIDMTTGPLTGKIIKFAIPLMLSGVLQLLFNAADMVVVGRFAGSGALASVGATGALIQLIINLFIGLSVGVNVLSARFYGANQPKELSETVHTAILTSLLAGVLLVFAGFFLSRPLLEMMDTPADVIEGAVLYMRIYFAGMPVLMLYNFGSAILRAVGDTRRPLYFLTFAGIINVLLNLFFVIVLHMGVAGVAIATVVSQAVSAFLVLYSLMQSDAAYGVRIKQLRIYPARLLEIVHFGVPAGIQSIMFSISNVLIQSSLNSFGSIAMAGNTAAANLEGFTGVAMDAFGQAAMSFVSQNYGAKKHGRINKVLVSCAIQVTVLGLILGTGTYLLGRPLLSIYSSDPEVIAYGMNRMLVLCLPHFLGGLMGVFSGAIRGLGSSVPPMVITVFGVCVLRVIWIYTVFATHHTLFTLYLSYPLTWGITALGELVCYFVIRRRMTARMEASTEG